MKHNAWADTGVPVAADVVRVDTRESALWRELVLGRPSDVFHSPAWHHVLHATYGFVPEGRVLLDAAGRPHAGIVTCLIDDLRGPRAVGLPFSDHCDPLVEDVGAWERLIADVPSEAPLRTRCLRSRVPLGDASMVERGRARWHAVDLRSTPEALWASFHGSSRRAICKAERAGVAVRASTHVEDLRGFFEAHLRVRKRKYGLLAQPYRFFEAILERFIAPGDGVLLVAEASGVPLAWVLLLTWRDRLYYKFNASLEWGRPVRPNDLLMWHAIRYGLERGYDLLDLGLSDWDQDGLVRYKRKYATEEGTITFVERPAVGVVMPAALEASALVSALTGMLTDEEVPDRVTERGGDLLYRYFT